MYSKKSIENIFNLFQIYIGLNIWVEDNVWITLMGHKKPSFFIRDMASIIWTPQKLVNRCFDINAKNLDKKVNRTSPRKKVESPLLKLLRGKL